MDETVIVIMIKNKESGILEKEAGCYRLHENDRLIYNTFATIEENGTINAHIKLTCGRDVTDWEFSAIYDYYDTEPLLNECIEVLETDDCFNPTWEAVFPLADDIAEAEAKIASILSIHKNELDEVYEAIKGKEGEYDTM